jgi:hypothetical protein
MASQKVSEAWVRILSEPQMRALIPAGETVAYDFGFIPAMGRLLMAHERIGPAFVNLYRQIMFAADGALSRQEREMVAAVAAAAQDCHY